jgi:thiosulfate/3-mercaptopyruvate sulfurtransferase
MDLDEIVDSENPVPHMLPPEHKFASRMQTLGLGDGNRFVVYDNSPLHSSARAWWMLKIFGAHHAAILDGGNAEMEGGRACRWKAASRRCVTAISRLALIGPQSPTRPMSAASSIRASTNWSTRGDRADLPARNPEPRAGVEGGHIPGSKNLPQGQVFSPTTAGREAANCVPCSKRPEST